ncbi:MAG: ECF transporter S component [Acidimicrobiales bacterium]
MSDTARGPNPARSLMAPPARRPTAPPAPPAPPARSLSLPGLMWVASALGLALFAWPFLGVGAPTAGAATAAAVGTLVALVVMELATRRLDARSFALLVSLSAIDAGARAALVSGIGGFSPIFLLILCGGYVFGPSYGFLLGATSLLVSALVTGGLGPWLPYQLFAVGWVGVAAGWVGQWRRRRAVQRRGRQRPSAEAWPSALDVGWLAAVGVVSGYAFGVIMDLWDWTFFSASPGLGFKPGMGLGVLAAHFGRFYLATSAVYDSFRAVGNAVLVVALGFPILVALARLRSGLTFEVISLEQALPELDAGRQAHPSRPG